MPQSTKVSWATWAGACALLFFIASACLFIPKFGIEGDEVDFVPPFYFGGSAGELIIHGIRLPTMFNSYLGTEKTYVYAPVLKAFHPSLWSLRLPVVLIGALSLWLLFKATRRLTNDIVAVAVVWLVASDPLYLLTTTFDWGPVALQHLFLIATFAFLARTEPMVFTGFLMLGLAWWDKSTASWVTFGMFGSAILLLPGLVRAHLSVRNAVKAVCGFAIGALPLLIFNIQNNGATFSDNAKLSTAGVKDSFWAMWASLNGHGMFDWLVRGGTPSWYTLPPIAMAAALLLLFSRRVTPVRPLALFAISTGLLTWLSMIFVVNGGTSLHHIILVWPWPHLFAVCVLGYALSKKPFAAVMVAIVLSNIAMTGLYAQYNRKFGPTPGFSDATSGLPDLLKNLPANRKLVITDWGMAQAVIYLTRGKLAFDDRTFSGLVEGDLANLDNIEFLAHAPGEEMTPGNEARLDAAIGKLGMTRSTDRVVTDSRGHPFFVSFHTFRPWLAPGTYDDTDSRIAFTGPWTRETRFPLTWQRTIVYSNAPDGMATMNIEGTGLKYVYTKAFNRGIAEVRVDGERKALIDLYGKDIQWQAETTISGLRPGRHEVSIRVTKTKNAAASDYYVDLDRVEVF